jgi:hypothetical protein
MIARDWILETLAELELWYWPVFFWELYWLDRYLKARRAENRSGLIGYAVARNGRIYITLQAFGDEVDHNDWTAFASRAPWERLAPVACVNALPLAAVLAPWGAGLSGVAMLTAWALRIELRSAPLIPP